MKRLLTFIILSLLILSIVPLASSQENGSQEAENRTVIKEEDLERTADTKLTSLRHKILTRGRNLFAPSHIEIVKRLSEEDLEEANRIGRIRDLMKYLSEHPVNKEIEAEKRSQIQASQVLSHMREIDAERQKVLQDTRLNLRDRSEDRDEDYNNLIRSYQRTILKIESCRFPTSSCRDADEDKIRLTKEILLNRLDASIDYLKRTKTRIELAQDLVEAEVTVRTADLQNKIDAMEALRFELEATESIKEMKLSYENISSIWKSFENKLMQHTKRLAHSKATLVIQGSEKMEEKLECGVRKLNENEANTVLADIMKTEFKMRVTQAEDAFEITETNFAQYEDVKRVEDSMERLTENIEGQHNVLMDFLREMTKNGVDISECQVYTSSSLSPEVRARVEEILRARIAAGG